jgi:hypothetical protein
LIFDPKHFSIGRRSALVISVLPVAMTVAMGLLLTTDATRWTMMKLSRENSLFELTTAGLMLGGGVFGLILTSRAKLRGQRWWVWGFFLAFSLGMLLVGMEELAWGQKLLGFETPAAFKDINRQGELTAHNLPWLQDRSDIMWGLFALGGLLGIGAGRWRGLEKIATPTVLVPWFVIILCISLPLTWKDLTGTENKVLTVLGRMDEFTEMMIAMASCLYLWLCARRLFRCRVDAEH